MGDFFTSWALWQQMTFVLAMSIVVVFIIGLVKLWWTNRFIARQEKVDEEKRSHLEEMRRTGLPNANGKTDIPFGVRAIQSGVEVDGIWISRPNTPLASLYGQDGHGPTASTTTLAAVDSNDIMCGNIKGKIDDNSLHSSNDRLLVPDVACTPPRSPALGPIGSSTSSLEVPRPRRHPRPQVQSKTLSQLGDRPLQRAPIETYVPTAAPTHSMDLGYAHPAYTLAAGPRLSTAASSVYTDDESDDNVFVTEPKASMSRTNIHQPHSSSTAGVSQPLTYVRQYQQRYFAPPMASSRQPSPPHQKSLSSEQTHQAYDGAHPYTLPPPTQSRADPAPRRIPSQTLPSVAPTHTDAPTLELPVIQTPIYQETSSFPAQPRSTPRGLHRYGAQDHLGSATDELGVVGAWGQGDSSVGVTIMADGEEEEVRTAVEQVGGKKGRKKLRKSGRNKTS